ncbi:MFS transporter [Nocardiopsis sp. HUAS JQ3]|uniref:MFS transporter n=1 Tax=Nocardiopsis sp. HUAS JQ3 TaxID=3061629 RepID=UPI0023A99CA3|nr:MFS transporter [Nocardiopsis sp. HUAS JQ3]WDZ93531.1 MFS transporter [Nocardiopsis sp. HUAS JQ3]
MGTDSSQAGDAPSVVGLGGAFHRFWAGHTSANLGDGVLLTLFPLMAAALTSDPLAVSMLTAAAYTPWLLFGLHAGALIDRIDKRRAMVVGNVVRCVLLGVLAVVSWFGPVPVWGLCLFVFALAVCEVFHDGSARALLPVLVARGLLVTANSRLQGTRVVASDFLGGPLAGLLFALSAGTALLFNAGVYLVGVLFLLAVPAAVRSPGGEGEREGDGRAPDTERHSLTREALEGLRFVRDDRVQRGFAAAAAVSGFATGGASAILVLYITRTLGVPEALFGVYTMLSPVGALAASFLCAPLGRWCGHGPLLITAHLLGGGALLTMGLLPGVVVGALALGVFGLAATTIAVSAGSILQAVTPEPILGRASMARMILAQSSVLLGVLTGGLLGGLGLPAPFAVGGVLLLAAPLVFGRVFREGAERAGV